MNKKDFSTRIKLNNVKIDDPFWNSIIELVRREVIPYQYDALHDRVEGAEKSYCIENFIKAGRVKKALSEGKSVSTYPADKWYYNDGNAESGAFHGWVFQDSDVYKWIEAVGYSLINHPDFDLEERAKKIIDIICDAQLENGYLDTLYIINNRDEIFTNLKDFHELYCFGHLAEAAISFYNATAERKLLDAALRFADLICNTFGEGRKRGYPGHEIAELALVKLYEVTGDEKYLNTAKFFVDERGREPFYFDLERGVKTDGSGYRYNQAHRPVRKQSEAVGHAVRGVYLYSGMAETAKHFCDEELYTACKNIWNNIENKKIYITGGIGATADGEAFSFNYDLPNDLAYSETCASIGLIFFARRMEEICANSRFADVAERALYNTVLSGMAEDGKSFFYVNPLEVNPEASKYDSRKFHIKPIRQKWFGCACCPPNIARLISSIGEYCFSENEDTVFVHQYIGSSVNAKKADITVESTYALDGKVKIKISPKERLTLALRIPSWSKEPKFTKKYKEEGGYAYFEISENTEISADFGNEIRLIKCSNLVRSNVGKAAVTRGAFVYCVEGVDNGNNLQLLKLGSKPNFKTDGEFIIGDGYREVPEENLYSEYEKKESTPCKIKFIPYYRWGNRGENEMQVYIRIKD